jgi:hypothetical protein
MLDQLSKLLVKFRKSDSFPHLLPFLIVGILLTPIFLLVLLKMVKYLYVKN